MFAVAANRIALFGNLKEHDSIISDCDHLNGFISAQDNIVSALLDRALQSHPVYSFEKLVTLGD